MVGDALSRFWHSRYYKVSRISKMLLSTVNSGPPNTTRVDCRQNPEINCALPLAALLKYLE